MGRLEYTVILFFYGYSEFRPVGMNVPKKDVYARMLDLISTEEQKLVSCYFFVVARAIIYLF